jgi:MFS family permease
VDDAGVGDGVDGDRERRATLAAVAGGNFAQLGSRLLVGAVVPLVLADFGTTRSSVGLALTGLWAVYALLQFPSGVLGDRYGERALVALALGATAAGVLAVALAPSVALFGACLLVLGAGAGLFFAPASSLVARLYDRQGQALGVLTASGGVAGVLFPAAGGVVGVRLGWRAAVALGAGTAAVALAGTLLAVPRRPPTNGDGSGAGRSLRTLVDFGRHYRLLARPAVIYSITVGVLVGFTFQGVTSFLPTFLVQYHGLRPDLAGLAFGVVFGLSSVAQPLAGRLSDRYSRDLAIATSATLALSGVAVLLAVRTTPGLVAGIGLLGVGVSWPGPVQARFFDQLGDEQRGYGFGLLRTVYLLIASLGSVAVGALVDVGGWPAGFGLLVAVLACCLLVLGLNRGLGLGL